MAVRHQHRMCQSAVYFNIISKKYYQRRALNELFGRQFSVFISRQQLFVTDTKARCKMEAAPNPHLALYPDTSIHQFHQFFANSEPKTGPSEFSRGGAVCLLKLLKYALAGFFRDSYAVVGHSDMDSGSIIFQRSQADFDSDLSPWTELDRVPHEIG